MSPEKPYSQACENNREPICSQLRRIFRDSRRVLEVGSGTGQHAVYFAANMPWLEWQTSDLADNHRGIEAWLADAALANVLPPLELDVDQLEWPCRQQYDAVFTANTLHIMPWASVESLFRGVDIWLEPGGRLCIYGPFNYGGRYTSDSNARFDQWLRDGARWQGIRDFEAVSALAGRYGLDLSEDIAMPANNRLLYWQRR